MMGRRTSNELYWQLMRDGMRPKTVGAVDASNEVASAPVHGEESRKRRHSPTARGERAELCWVNTNPAFRKSAGREGATFLKTVPK